MGLWRSNCTAFCEIMLLFCLSDALLLDSISRRMFIQWSPAQYLLLVTSLLEEETSQPKDAEIVKLLTGVQYRDVRVGKGDAVRKGDTAVMHVRSLLRDDSVLFDTREDGGPLMLEVGSINDNLFPDDKFTSSRITPGVEDAILSKRVGKPMVGGGVRLVVVPSALAYGNAGLSRFDAFRMKLRQAVPRDEIVRYEVEILRCLEVDIPYAQNNTGQVCCTEPSFPCKIEESQIKKS